MFTTKCFSRWCVNTFRKKFKHPFKTKLTRSDTKTQTQAQRSRAYALYVTYIICAFRQQVASVHARVYTINLYAAAAFLFAACISTAPARFIPFRIRDLIRNQRIVVWVSDERYRIFRLITAMKFLDASNFIRLGVVMWAGEGIKSAWCIIHLFAFMRKFNGRADPALFYIVNCDTWLKRPS